jgi:hypothetical protein
MRRAQGDRRWLRIAFWKNLMGGFGKEWIKLKASALKQKAERYGNDRNWLLSEWLCETKEGNNQTWGGKI